jgi:hypothetical protein
MRLPLAAYSDEIPLIERHLAILLAKNMLYVSIYILTSSEPIVKRKWAQNTGDRRSTKDGV